MVEQETLSYATVLKELKPDFVVHGDNWKTGIQKEVRDEVIEILASYGGRLVEFPYAGDPKLQEIENLTAAKEIFKL